MSEEQKTLKPRGFAGMDREKVREIARKGGILSHQMGKAHVFTKEQAKSAGKKGGLAVQAKKRKLREELESESTRASEPIQESNPNE